MGNYVTFGIRSGLSVTDCYTDRPVSWVNTPVFTGEVQLVKKPCRKSGVPCLLNQSVVYVTPLPYLFQDDPVNESGL